MSRRSVVAVYDVVDDDHFESPRYRGSFVMFGKVELPAVPASSQSNGVASDNFYTGLGSNAATVGGPPSLNTAAPSNAPMQTQAQSILSLPTPPSAQPSASEPTYSAFLR